MFSLLFRVLSCRFLSYSKKRKISRNKHWFSLFVTRCQSLYHSLWFAVTRWHSLSLAMPLVKSSHRRCSVKKGVLRNFAKFTGKHLCQSLFLCRPFLQNTSGRMLPTRCHLLTSLVVTRCNTGLSVYKQSQNKHRFSAIFYRWLLLFVKFLMAI